MKHKAIVSLLYDTIFKFTAKNVSIAMNGAETANDTIDLDTVNKQQ